MNAFTIYLGGPITGKTANEVFDFFEKTAIDLRNEGFRVLHPMIGKDNLRTEVEFKDKGYVTNPVTTDKAITARDNWAVNQSDILFMDFSSSGDRVSIGSVIEIAWASQLNKQIVVVIPEGNIHAHAMLLQSATVVFESRDEAMFYLQQYSAV